MTEEEEFEARCEREKDARILKFNELYATYLKREGECAVWGEDEEAMAKVQDEAWEALWGLIRTRAEMPYQIAYKVGIYRNMMTDVWVDARSRHLFESIILDFEKLGNWDFASC